MDIEFVPDIELIIDFELAPCTFCKEWTKCPREYACVTFMKWRSLWKQRKEEANKEE